MRTLRASLSVAVSVGALLCPVAASAQHYTQTNLVSDTAVSPVVQDSNLRNAWGLVHGPATPWWVSDNATGLSTLYDASTTPVTIRSLVVTVPGAPGQTTGTPTAVLFNGSPTDFLLAPGKPALFIWATEDGTISGWNPGVDATHAVIKVDHSQKPTADRGAIYKGATITEIAGHKYLLAANFRSGRIEMFDTAFMPVHLTRDAFRDQELPNGFAPFNIQGIGQNIYVMYAKQDAMKHDDVPGAGLGYVDVFSPRGELLARLQHGSWLNAPWGVVLAPADFGEFSHALLVGNFGSGRIAAFNPLTGRFLGNVLDPSGSVLAIDGLWGLAFGNGGASGPGNTLFFTAGPNDEADGLFGTLMPIASELNENDEQ